MVLTRDRREPRWSGALTRSLAGRIPARCRRATIAAVLVIHTAAFLSIASLIVLVAVDGLRGRPSRRTAVAASVAIAEAALYGTNNQVCPLTPLVEELGAERGSVTDILLPAWLSRRIPVIFGPLLLVGLLLNGRTVLARTRR